MRDCKGLCVWWFCDGCAGAGRGGGCGWGSPSTGDTAPVWQARCQCELTISLKCKGVALPEPVGVLKPDMTRVRPLNELVSKVEKGFYNSEVEVWARVVWEIGISYIRPKCTASPSYLLGYVRLRLLLISVLYFWCSPCPIRIPGSQVMV